MKVGKDGWLTLDVATDMSAECAEAYAAYKAAYKVAQAAKARYESAMTAEVAPQGKALVFGYNFGVASIKIVDASERQERRTAKPQQSLADYLASQQAGGYSC